MTYWSHPIELLLIAQENLFKIILCQLTMFNHLVRWKSNVMNEQLKSKLIKTARASVFEIFFINKLNYHETI